MKGKIAVFGDIMLDRYSYGDVTRLNPEDVTKPLVLRDKSREEYKLGGAANVAANIASLLKEVMLVGAITLRDEAGRRVSEETKKQNILFNPVFIDSEDAMTIVKHRIIGDNKYLLRIDDEHPIALSDYQSKRAVDFLKKYQPEYLIISDYAKGTVSTALVKALKATVGRSTKFLVDTKPSNVDMFTGAYLIKPNFKEFRQMVGREDMPNEDDAVAQAGKLLSKKYDTNIMVTRSEKGATLITKEGEVSHIPTHAKDIVDVSGAGDTFLATVGVALSE